MATRPLAAVDSGHARSSDWGAARLRASDVPLPPRPPGPPRGSPAQIAATRAEIARLTRAFLREGIAPREVASLADIRGARLYRGRFFAQARLWYEAGVSLDARFETVIYNAARTAALLGDHAAAHRHLVRLEGLGTPLARRRLALVAMDADFAQYRALRRSR